ncbi:MAG TPA: ROK family transcriptional regulator [Candidatus Acidoferrum sp.]|nr:ROK family transcriptional regulator [Candidatus Acidoferrum sp.]
MAAATKTISARPARTARRFKIKRDTVALQQADLLLRVRAGDGTSRVELARTMNLAPSTVGIYVDHLVTEGFLTEGKGPTRELGRPPTLLALNPQGGRFIGVDFEARNIMAIAVDFSQRPLKRFHDTIGAAEPVESIVRKIEHAIQTVSAGDDRQLLAIGVGVPGVIDPEKGVALSYKHIKGWENVPLMHRLSHRFGVPVFVENTVRTMALAELWFGQGRGLRNFICLGMRSGLGAGIIIDGQIYRGADNRAGEIGDWPCEATNNHGASKRGSRPAFTRLEDIASLHTLRDRLGAPGQAEAPLEALLRAAAEGDKVVLGFLDRVAHAFGLVLNQLNCAFNPEKIILAGALAGFGEHLRLPLERNLTAFAPPSGAPAIVSSELGAFNGAIGAAALAVHQWKPVPP